MIKKVKKRNGEVINFNRENIIKAILSAADEVKKDMMANQQAFMIAFDVERSYEKEMATVEEIQDKVIAKLFRERYDDIAVKYMNYRYDREWLRMQKSIIGIIDNSNEEVCNENSNKKSVVVSTQRDLMAGELSKAMARKMIPKKCLKAHDLGIIKIHDMDYFSGPTTNCELINLEDMLQNGTVISGKMIEKPKSLRTAMNIATQIAAQVASSTYGGQTLSLTHLAPFVDISRKKIEAEVFKEYNECFRIAVSEEIVEEIVEKRLKKEIKDSVQLFNYQISTLLTTNGQSPFISVVMYLNEDTKYTKDVALLIEEFLNQRIAGMKNEFGVIASQTFPKLLYFLDENNTKEGSEYYDLTVLAAKSVAKRMSPDFISVKRMKEVHKIGKAWAPMGCRSFLNLWKNKEGEYQFYGRGNMGVTTINLPYIALLSKESGVGFESYLNDFMEDIVKPAVLLRYEKLKGVKANVAPIMWMNGAISRLKATDDITEVLKDGRFSVSIGYSGVYETVKVLTGESHTSEKGHKFALELMEFLYNKANEWKAETGLGVGMYGTPAESTAGVFADKIKERFGEIEDVTDKGFLTNSFHVDVRENIDAFSKLSFEATFEKYSAGGVVNYVETPNMEKNIEAVLQILDHIYETIIYGEINTESDSCGKCGFSGCMDHDPITLDWVCPQCGNKDQEAVSVIRRTCGYLGQTTFSKGRKKDINARVKHI